MTLTVVTPDNAVTGSSFVGLPGIVIGHNRWIAWGVTNTGADVQDLYAMQEPDGDRDRYFYRGEFVPYVLRKETIRIKDKGIT